MSKGVCILLLCLNFCVNGIFYEQSKLFIFAPPAPSLVPDFVAVHNKSSTSLIAKWSQLPGEYFQGEPIGYNITYYPVDSKSDKRFVTVNYTLNSSTLSNLTVFTMYVINVSAVSSGGVGPANTVKARTRAEGKNLFSSRYHNS